MHQDLTALWAGHRTWTVLDTEFLRGGRFLEIHRLWRADTTAPQVLHYVGLSATASAAGSNYVLEALIAGLADTDLSDAAPDFMHLYPGFNRILLAGGRIALTICMGDDLDMLKELRMQADSVLLPAACATWSDGHWAQLALNCRTGARLYAPDTADLPFTALRRHGFRPAAVAQTSCTAIYQPPWTIKRTRRLVNSPLNAGRCAVIGGGLSGAAVARALALRGWQVTVYDALPAPAGAASGLPVGLCVPLQSADNNPLSQLSRQGVRLTLSHARRLLAHGKDWRLSGVIEKIDPQNPASDICHTHAGWIKPAALVRAWLNHPSILWLGGTHIAQLSQHHACWTLQGDRGEVRGQADLVVLANAHGCRALIASLDPQCPLIDDAHAKFAAMQMRDGTLCMGPDTAPVCEPPMNGSGSWISGVPTSTGTYWAAGATYEPHAQRTTDTTTQDAENLRKLRLLSPAHARTMELALHNGTLRHWSGTRCVSHDRLPLVGPLDDSAAPTLWICAAMGSRGMSLAALSAELLAAYIGSEPLPLPARLAKCLSSQRPLKGRKRQDRASA